MPNLEPAYLRYIYDGLIKGSIHPENAAELPDGLIGLYEEAIDERTSVVERQKLLQRFAIWALLKKEVSAAFVAEVLGETEDEIQEFISTYSAWFNSPESGKYQLYHERLKVYLLQKLSEQEIHTLHEQLVSRLEQAIEEQKADEFEWYGLEFLAGHLGVSAMLNGDGKKLIELAYSQAHWQRQLKISKGYSWTKNVLKEVMAWASKYNDDEVIECGLQMVDLHHLEQNAAPQIVALVAEGEFDAALKRIEQFGGNDKQGLQRKFILYMLCLMELTLLESKDKPYRKEGIEKLLQHLDEQLPVDHSVLNWNDFFPSYMMFFMASEWNELGLDYLLVYKRTDYWETDWLSIDDSLSKLHLNTLLKCARNINDKANRSEILAYLSIELSKKGDFLASKSIMHEALSAARSISSAYSKCCSLSFICNCLLELKIESKLIFEEAYSIAYKLKNDSFNKCKALLSLASHFLTIATENEFKLKLSEIFHFSKKVDSKRHKTWIIARISSLAFKKGLSKECDYFFQEVLWLINEINSSDEEADKCLSYEFLISELSEQQKFDLAFQFVEKIEIPFVKEMALKSIAIELIKAQKIEDGIEVARQINDDIESINLFGAIYSMLIKRGNNKPYEILLSECLDRVKKITNGAERFLLLLGIVKGITNDINILNFILNEALIFHIDNDVSNSKYIESLIGDLTNKGEIPLANKLINVIPNLSNWERNNALMLIAVGYSKQGFLKKAIKTVNNIDTLIMKNNAKLQISNLLFSQGDITKSSHFLIEVDKSVEKIDNIFEKIIHIVKVSKEYAAQNKRELAVKNLEKSIELCSLVVGRTHKNLSFSICSILFAELGMLPTALALTEKINDISVRITTYSEIATVLYGQNDTRNYKVTIDKLVNTISLCDFDSLSNYDLVKIIVELTKQRNWILIKEILYKSKGFVLINESCVEIGAIYCQEMGAQIAFSKIPDFIENEMKKYYFMGILNVMCHTGLYKKSLLSTLPYYLNDISSITNIFQNYALNELFFQDSSAVKLERLNRTLNIQWAIDIKNQLGDK